jgi:hypothetical protein
MYCPPYNVIEKDMIGVVSTNKLIYIFYEIYNDFIRGYLT